MVIKSPNLLNEKLVYKVEFQIFYITERQYMLLKANTNMIHIYLSVYVSVVCMYRCMVMSNSVPLHVTEEISSKLC